MATTTLPHIQPGPTQLTAQSPIKQPISPAGRGPSSSTRAKRIQNKKEKELAQRREQLRGQLPFLPKKDTSEYRNTYLHNVCVTMLEEGFHKSFSELFALIQRQREDRERAGPDSILWNNVQLYDEYGKLDTLQRYLCEAEAARREGAWAVVYDSQWSLAQYFQEKGDKWLSDHFYNSCLETGDKVTADEGYKRAEGHCNVGLAHEESGSLYKAAEQFEAFYELCEKHRDWRTREDQSMFETACEHLTRTYTNIAQQLVAGANLAGALEYFVKAHERAEESGNRDLEGKASYRLGNAYHDNKDHETALKHLTHYFEVCESKKDSDGLGEACESIAKAYESLDQVPETIRYLERFVQVSQDSGNEKALAKACAALGGVYNSLGKYVEATEYFNRAYNVSRALNDMESVSQSRVQFGVAAAHRMLLLYSRHLNAATPPCMMRIFDWKSSRVSDFDKPLPQPEETVEVEVKKTPTPEVEEKKEEEKFEEEVAMPEEHEDEDADDEDEA